MEEIKHTKEPIHEELIREDSVQEGVQPTETTIEEVSTQSQEQAKGNESRREPEPPKPSKELTPAERQRRKKMLVYPLIFLIFGAAMWLIFAPSITETENGIQEGFNVDVPLPQEKGLLDDKKEAYEQEAFDKQQREKMGTLEDFDIALAESDEEVTVSDPSAVLPETDNSRPATSSVRSSAAAYQDINHQLGSFYQQPEPEDDQKQLELEWRIQELERTREEQEQKKSAVDEQLELMEKSYQMAAKYMPASQSNNPPNAQPAQPTPATTKTASSDKPAVTPVMQVQEKVVSLLAPPMSDADFIRVYSKPRNVGFNTVRSSEENIRKNTIRARVYQTITLTDGKELQLRTSEAMMAGGQYIPAGTVIVGKAKIGGERMEITVSAVSYSGAVIPVSLEVYDTQGMQGVSVPGSDELNAVKEIAANMGSSLGTSISITESAGAQLAADLGKGAIQGTSQYLSKKFRTVKVTLKAGHELYLLPGN